MPTKSKHNEDYKTSDDIYDVTFWYIFFCGGGGGGGGGEYDQHKF